MSLWTLLLGLGLAGPPLAVGAAAFGVPWPGAAAALVAVAAIACWRDRAALATAFAALRRQPALFVVPAVAVTAVAFNVRLSQFMHDPARVESSVFPARKFFREHSCLTSYTEGARLAFTGANIFDQSHYVPEPAPGQYESRYIGPFEVDIYQYPPPFLVLPSLPVTAGLDFLSIRAIWFAIQALLLFGAMAALAAWIGGRPGAVVLALVPVFWLAPTTRVCLQMGNFHLTAFSLAVLAMVAFHRGRSGWGGAALGFAAASKIFPGALAIVLLLRGRWAALAWTAAAGVAVSAAAWLWIGPKPFLDFVRYQLPRLESGEAFFWIDFPEMAPLNHSVHGLVMKLRQLGAASLDRSAANVLSSVFALGVVGAAWHSATRLSRLDFGGGDPSVIRLRHAQVWVGLVGLASFRSPFVPDAYALISSLWLLTLIAAERDLTRRGWIALGVAAIAFCVVLDGGLVPTPVPAWMLLLTLAIQLAALAVNFTAVLAPHRGLAQRLALTPSAS